MADDAIDCTDLTEFDELHALACKVLPGEYPRTVGAQAWKVPPNEDGTGGVAEWYGGGRHVAVTVTGHVAPLVDQETGKVRMPVTPQLRAALTAENTAAAKDRKLSDQEKARLDTAVAEAKPLSIT